MSEIYKTIVKEAKAEGVPYEKAIALAKRLELQLTFKVYIKQHISRRGGHYYVSPEVAAIVIGKE